MKHLFCLAVIFCLIGCQPPPKTVDQLNEDSQKALRPKTGGNAK